MRRVWLSVALSCIWLTHLGASQTRDQRPELSLPVGTSSISGTVIAEETGRPIRAARVVVEGRATAGGPELWLSRTTYTDASGQFLFPRLPTGRFTFSVRAENYLTYIFGQRRYEGRGRNISLADGQQVTLQIPMRRGGVITGTVFDPNGEPLPDIRVRCLRVDGSTGFLRIVPEADARTDDRGVYRMHGLYAGEYLVLAEPGWPDDTSMLRDAEAIERLISTGRVRPPAAPGLPSTVALLFGRSASTSKEYLPVYAPSALVPSGATRLIVRGGDVKSGVDVLLRLMQSTDVVGKVLAADPAVPVQLVLASDDPTIDGHGSQTTRADESGEFSFSNIPPGRYTLMAQTVPAAARVIVDANGTVTLGPGELTDAQRMWATVPVVVSGEPEVNISVPLQPARSISGVVVFDTKKQVDLNKTNVTVRLSSAPALRETHLIPLPDGRVGPDGRFTLKGVLPGRYKLWLNSVHLKSAVVGGQETLDFGLDFTAGRDITDAVLTVTDSVSELSGTLADAAGKPASDVSIVVVPSDARLCGPGSRRTFVSEPEADGRYSITGLPAGAYVIAVVTDLEPGAQYDLEFLRLIRSTGVSVTIADGAKVTQNLRVK